MALFDVITIGGAVRDTTFYTNQYHLIPTPHNLTSQKQMGFEYGAKISSREVFVTLGGGAANAGVNFSRLGFKTGIITRVGRDVNGRAIEENLKKEKVSVTLLQRDAQEQSAFSFIVATQKKEKDHVVFAFNGSTENLKISSPSFKHNNAKWFYITSLSGKNWQKNLLAIFKYAQSKQIKIAWNPGIMQLQAGKRLLSGFLKRTDILILNKDEAIELVLSGLTLGRKNPAHLNKPLYLLNILQDWGAKITLITEGKKGASVCSSEKIYKQKIIRSKVVDTTGVGDCFGSSFLAGYIYESGQIAKALKWAAINASSVVTKVGAQNGLLTRAELKKKLK